MKSTHLTPLATLLLTLALAVASNTAAAQDDAVTEPEQFEQPPATEPDDSSVSRNGEETTESDTDCVDLPEGAAGNAQAAVAANTQGAGENQSGARADSDEEITRNRDDCLDIRSAPRDTED